MPEVAHPIATPAAVAASAAQPAHPVAEAAAGTVHDALALTRMLELLAWAIGADGPFSGAFPTSPKEHIRKLAECTKSLTTLSMDPTDSHAAEIMLTALRTAYQAAGYLQSHMQAETETHRGTSRGRSSVHPTRIATGDHLDIVGAFLVNLQAKVDELSSAALSQAKSSRAKGSR